VEDSFRSRRDTFVFLDSPLGVQKIKFFARCGFGPSKENELGTPGPLEDSPFLRVARRGRANRLLYDRKTQSPDRLYYLVRPMDSNQTGKGLARLYLSVMFQAANGIRFVSSTPI
jgi:hypothetical protein